MPNNANLLKKATIAIVTLAVLLAAIGVFYPYSYWTDEIFSVSATDRDFSAMFSLFLLPDVHPPLYQTTLYFWVNALGSSEIATRSLSFLFAALALSYMTLWGAKRLSGLSLYGTIIFFASCHLFPFYAQETRSYAMMLFLSTAVTTFYLDWTQGTFSNRKLLSFCVFLILLSLTHYFGFIFSGIIIIIVASESIINKRGRDLTYYAISGIVCWVWPITHYSLGGIGSRDADSFWIDSNGLQTTLEKLSYAFSPQINFFSSFLPKEYEPWGAAFGVTSFLAILPTVFYFTQNIKGLSTPSFSRWAHLIIFLFLLVILFSDYIFPISTVRNFIVVLPILSILIGLTVNDLHRAGFKNILYIFIIGAASNSAVSIERVLNKTAPRENPKAAANFISTHYSDGDCLYYLANDSYGKTINEAKIDFYFEKNINPEPIEFEDIKKLSGNYFVYMPHQSHDTQKLVSKMRSRGESVKRFVPQPTDSVVVLYSESSISK